MRTSILDAFVRVALFAAETPMERLARGIRRRTEADATPMLRWLIGLAAVALVAWLVMKAIERVRRARTEDRPWWLFLGLCRAHELAWRDCWLLWRVAHRARLSAPAVAFLDPRVLADGRAWCHSDVQQQRLTLIAQRLFGNQSK
jgi:hypothetical protein